jgi:predicted DCC family thiol-disulfide oxidoreductase YuxK
MITPESIKNNSHIILFDGVCNLCSGFMQFVYKRDTKAIFKFVWLQDDTSKEILNWLNLDSNNFKTIILIENDKPYYKSTAFLKIVRYLHFPWPLLTIGYTIPQFFRDCIYDYVAKNRYRWFGKKETCLIPTGELLKRFSLRRPTF